MTGKQNITIQRLSQHPDLESLITSWLREEWPDWYGPSGKGSAQDDVRMYSRAGNTIPLGLVASHGDVPCGFGALKNEGIPRESGRGPWVGAGYVQPELRGRGIGALLLRALVREARLIGFAHVYCGTSTSMSLLAREGWEELEVVQHEEARIVVFRSPA
jgi:GNAT superfamily N-acetyltransferase